MELAIMVVLLLSDTGVWYNGRGGGVHILNVGQGRNAGSELSQLFLW